MPMVTLTNDFHNTKIRVRLGDLSARTVRRCKRALCAPDSGCTCSDFLGRRGRQVYCEDYDWLPRPDGSAKLIVF